MTATDGRDGLLPPNLCSHERNRKRETLGMWQASKQPGRKFLSSVPPMRAGDVPFSAHAKSPEVRVDPFFSVQSLQSRKEFLLSLKLQEETIHCASRMARVNCCLRAARP